jgi:uncharacterized protein YceK
MPASSRAVLVALAAVVVLAGCGGVVDSPSPTAGDPPAGTDAPTAAATTPDDGATAVATDRRTTAATAESPWGDTVVVGVDGSGTRDYASLVRRATAYWEANDSRYLGYEIDYVVRPDAAAPDLVVRFVDDVPDCNGRGDAVGCAPLVTDARQITRPETVYVQTGLSDRSTVLVTAHELGHTLGLTHDDPPADVMRAATVLYTTPQPNATERDLPWSDAEFTVHVDVAGAEDPDGARAQVDHALDYYRGDPDGVPSNLTFERTDSPEAEILIRFGDCGSGAASCVQTSGPDPDGDGAMETYSRLVVTVDDIDTDAVGWHVGYWLAYGFGAEADSDKPAPFRDASYRDRRSEWWR